MLVYLACLLPSPLDLWRFQQLLGDHGFERRANPRYVLSGRQCNERSAKLNWDAHGQFSQSNLVSRRVDKGLYVGREF